MPGPPTEPATESPSVTASRRPHRSWHVKPAAAYTKDVSLGRPIVRECLKTSARSIPREVTRFRSVRKLLTEKNGTVGRERARSGLSCGMAMPPANASEIPPARFKIVSDSAGALAIASVLLFAWRFAADSATYFYRGVPQELIPRLPLQEYLMDGGALGLLLFVLPLLLLDWVAHAIERQRGKPFAWRNLARTLTSRQLAVAIAFTLFVTVLLVSWTAQAFIGPSQRARVVSVKLETGQLAPQYRGLMVAAYTEGRYILVDRFARDAKVYVLNADDITELQLENWAPDPRSRVGPSGGTGQ